MKLEAQHIDEPQKQPLLIADVISRFFKDKAKEHGVNEANLFIENRITHLSGDYIPVAAGQMILAAFGMSF